MANTPVILPPQPSLNIVAAKTIGGFALATGTCLAFTCLHPSGPVRVAAFLFSFLPATATVASISSLCDRNVKDVNTYFDAVVWRVHCAFANIFA